MRTLEDIARTTSPGCDKASWGHNYLPQYEALFSPLRDKPIKFLEIGVQFGLSIKMWLEYFLRAQIFGVDIEDFKSVEHERYTFVIGNQRDPEFWNRFIAQYGGDWDVIMDDGEHKTRGIVTSFEALWPHVKSGGCYLIEDLMCSYYAQNREPDLPPQMEFIKGLLDDINCQTAYINTPQPRLFSKSTRSDRQIEWLRMTEELAVIRKK